MIPDILIGEVAGLKKAGYHIQLKEVGSRIYIIFKNYPLPENFYTQNSTNILVWTTSAYPNAAFDMFWTDQSLLLLGNRMPKAANSIESHMGKQWRRFSIHPYQTKRWNPFEDSLNSYLTYIEQRLNSGV